MSAETRRSGRLSKQLAILLIGSDIEGRMFSERTRTVILSRHGAGIVSEYKLSAEQELVIRLVDSNKEAEVRVVGQIGKAGDTYIYGVAFLQPDINFWDINFPALTEAEKRASRTLLECSKCRNREAADHSDLESDVYAINESIMRYCKRCGSSTLWKQPSGDLVKEEMSPPSFMPPPRAGVWQPHATSSLAHGQGSEFVSEHDAPVAMAPASAPTPTPPAATPEKQVHSKDRDNRRKHGRTRVNFKACIRRAGSPDDVVACEDMSRGGIRFKSPKQYFKQALIEVAVPYTPGEAAIFVPAQIAWILELPEQKLWRCGVTYLGSGK
jgi:PilZ domain-containing protein